jgi:antirestriction protein ArdC
MLTNNLYQSVTDKIVAEIEAGTIPWAQPWEGGPVMPANAVTGRPYSGINTLILMMAARDRGYRAHGWMTFKQANEIGASVRKGEKATPVAFVKFLEGEDGEKKVPVLRTFYVFNTAQIDNLPAAYQPQEPKPRAHDEKYEEALRFAEGCGIPIIYGADRCCYIPSQDEIQMVDYGRFKSDDDWFGVVAHELVHATGHKSRLNREYGRRFGDAKYAFEELVAEIGSAFISSRIGFQPIHRSAAYVESWLKVLKDDKRAIFSAASYASHAADYLVEAAEHAVTENTPEVERGLEAAE